MSLECLYVIVFQSAIDLHKKKLTKTDKAAKQALYKNI